ncbi:MAG: hypothetical protein MK213_02020 [Planctomycetes bacterium]|nr:hypothetical protein [Planctomycetota bacterium]
MGHIPTDARSARAVITDRRSCGPDAFIFELEFAEDLPAFQPGCFAMLSPAVDSPVIVPRPFSVFDRTAANRVTFLIQVMGDGTRSLGELQLGEEVQAILPLGNGFSPAPPEREVVLVAGGVGSAPFLLYAKERINAGAGAKTSYFYGARTADRLYDRAAFDALDLRCVHATDDGSLGFHGNVVQALTNALDERTIGQDALFCACGPEGLLHGFAAFARDRNLEYELSLETYMGCGFGVCNGCPTPTQPEGAFGDWPWVKTCLDGPVFCGTDIQF